MTTTQTVEKSIEKVIQEMNKTLAELAKEVQQPAGTRSGSENKK